jgi:hypothetical protein
MSVPLRMVYFSVEREMDWGILSTTSKQNEENSSMRKGIKPQKTQHSGT